MLGFTGFIKKKLDLDNKLPNKWKTCTYYCFSAGDTVKHYVKVDAQAGDNFYWASSTASTFPYATSPKDLELAGDISKVVSVSETQLSIGEYDSLTQTWMVTMTYRRTPNEDGTYTGDIYELNPLE